MEKDKNLVKYLLFGGALGLSYLIIQYLSNRKKSSGKPLSLEQTIKLLQEVKYQVLTTCFNYAEAVSLKLKGGHAEKDLQIVFRTELAKIYEARESAVLNKHDISKEEYGVSLQKHRKEEKVKKGLAQVFDMMERAVQGKVPDLTVLPQAQQHLSKEQLLSVYFEMCELISIRLWHKLEQNRKNNPGFNSKDEAHYQKAIKDLSIFDIKTEFLKTKGFRQEWGSPNEIFYKIMEFTKQKDPDFKAKAAKVEKAYQKTIEAVTTQTAQLTPERITFMLKEASNSQSEPRQPVIQSQPQAPARPFPMQSVTKSLGKEAKGKKNEEEDELQNLMMQQLLNRSAEDPKDSEPVKEEVNKDKEVSESKPEPAAEDIPQQEHSVDRIEEKQVSKAPQSAAESSELKKDIQLQPEVAENKANQLHQNAQPKEEQAELAQGEQPQSTEVEQLSKEEKEAEKKLEEKTEQQPAVEKAEGEEKPVEKAEGEEKPVEKAEGEEKPVEKVEGEEKPEEKAEGEEKPEEKAEGEEKPEEKAEGKQKEEIEPVPVPEANNLDGERNEGENATGEVELLSEKKEEG